MPEASEFADLARFRDQGDDPIPRVVLGLHPDPQLVWRNELGGLTYRVGARFVKWSPRTAGIELARERDRLLWLEGRHPAPRVVSYGNDEQAEWIVTNALGGEHAVGPTWQKRPSEAIEAIARGLRAIHAVPVDDEARGWESWLVRTPPELGARPPVSEPVLVHGDACAPNTLISDDGAWIGNVDFGDLAVGDRWADLAIASMSLDWNFGRGHQEEFFAAYGIGRDEERIRYYRALWDLES
jgi:kanamycin kinase